MLAGPREVVAVVKGGGLKVSGTPALCLPHPYLPIPLPRPWRTLTDPSPVDLPSQEQDETV